MTGIEFETFRMRVPRVSMKSLRSVENYLKFLFSVTGTYFSEFKILTYITKLQQSNPVLIFHSD